MPFEVTMLVAIFVAIVLLSYFTVMVILKGVCNLVSNWYQKYQQKRRSPD